MKGKIDWQGCLPKIQEIAEKVYNALLWAMVLGIILFAMVIPFALFQDNMLGLLGRIAILIYVLLIFAVIFFVSAKNDKLCCEILCRITIYGASMMLMLLVIRAMFRDIPVVALLIAGGIVAFVIGATFLESEHISRYIERVARKGKAMLIAGMIEVIAFVVGGYCAVMLLYANGVLELPKVSDGLIAGITLAHIGLLIGLYYLLRYVWQQYLLWKYRYSVTLQEILQSYDGDTVVVKFEPQTTMVDAFIEYGIFCNRVYDHKLNDADRYHIRFSHFVFLQKANESRKWLSENKRKKRSKRPL